jgi:hypothetical protein
MNFSPNSKALRELKAKLVGLTNVQFEAAIGLILGDASIQSQNKGSPYSKRFSILVYGRRRKIGLLF